MYVLKAFAVHSQLANNTIGVVAPIGELSTLSLTYARDKGQYRSNDAPNVTLVTFTSAQDDTPIAVSPDMTTHVMLVVKAMFDFVFARAGQAVFADELLNTLTPAFDTVAQDFQCGAITAGDTISAPEWLSWTNNSIAGLGGNTLKVWFSDAAFAQQYDDFEIIVIPPTPSLNDFFKTPTEVALALAAQTPSATMERVQAAKGGYPETVVRAETFNYTDPFNPQHVIPATWHVLIYGAAGNNIDSVSDALVQNALDNSTHSRNEWLTLVPDLFRRTEFIMVPMWDQYAIPNRVVEAGIYSPVANLKRAVALIKQVVGSVVNYPDTHINDHVSIMAHPFKSLQILSVGSADNRNNWFELSQVFPDILAVSSTGLDFNRMSAATKTWLTALAEMLVVAETMSRYSSIPSSYTKITRGGILYIVKRYGNVNYLLAAKTSLPVVITGE